MDTFKPMQDAIDYIEDNLVSNIDYGVLGKIALCSPYHFQRMFVFLVGIPLSEYIRRRRLTLAAFDLQNSNAKIIDVALQYGYSSPDAFSRAFYAMHGVLPSKAKDPQVQLKAYPRITLTISIKGVLPMNYRLVEKPGFRVAGVKKRFSYIDELGKSIGMFWSQVTPEIYQQLHALGNGEAPMGIYAGMYDDNTTDYYIAVETSKTCPPMLEELVIPPALWAIFEITGPLPEAMAEMWGRIHTEWFPTCQFEHAEAPEIEWYSPGDMSAASYSKGSVNNFL